MAHMNCTPAAALALAVALVAAISASAQSTACTTALVSLSPCLSYIGGNATAPAASCCSQLATVVRSEPQCLCLVLSGAPSFGVSINQTQALALPSACKIQTPPASECNKVAGGAGAPAGSPTSSPTDGGSKSTPGVSTAGGSAKMSFSLVFLALFLLPLVLTNGSS